MATAKKKQEERATADDSDEEEDDDEPLNHQASSATGHFDFLSSVQDNNNLKPDITMPSLDASSLYPTMQ